jgi:hypothetical protein
MLGVLQRVYYNPTWQTFVSRNLNKFAERKGVGCGVLGKLLNNPNTFYKRMNNDCSVKTPQHPTPYPLHPD